MACMLPPESPDAPDPTHDPALISWVESANVAGCDFPIQNLPFGRFRRRRSDGAWRCGVAIGDQVLDLQLATRQCPWPEELYTWLEPLAAGDLGGFMALGRPAWKAVRRALSDALALGSEQGPFLELCLWPQRLLEMGMPVAIGAYTDFFAGIHHARAVAQLQRPGSGLLPNYAWLPLGYHGRASSVGLGGPVQRPHGQMRSRDGTPRFGPTRRLDHELELGLLVGTGNEPGRPLTMDEAADGLFGVVLLNDWSARDIQAWESQPLGPFLSKSFATSISPWVVTMEALAPFRRPFVRPASEPQPLPYLDSPDNRAGGALDIRVEAWLQAAGQTRPVPISSATALDLYWTPAQLLAHHASNGCPLHTGDLLGTGTLSGPLPGQGGSMLELSDGGRQPLQLPGGVSRTFLEDGDTLILRAHCQAPDAVRIGFGELRGTVVA